MILGKSHTLVFFLSGFYIRAVGLACCLPPSVRAMAWPGPRPGQAKIVGLQANDSYFSYRDLE